MSDALKGDDSQVFYLQKVDEINPNIRYCNYNLGDESAKKDLLDLKLKSATGSELAENIDVKFCEILNNNSVITGIWFRALNLKLTKLKFLNFMLNYLFLCCIMTMSISVSITMFSAYQLFLPIFIPRSTSSNLFAILYRMRILLT